MSEFSIDVKNLSRKFESFTAVDDISFSVRKGEIYGFLGANGAGKTTTIRMLCGLLQPTSGDAKVAGISIKDKPEEVKKCIGYMSQKFSLYPVLTVEENIEFFAGIYGKDKKFIEKRLPEVCEATGLTGLEKRTVGELASGLKQRLALACAIMHDPEIVFLDEPTSGVDPFLRRRFWDIIRFLSDSGKTIFVTTHYMDEVEHCHRIALMHAGRIIKEGTIPEIKKSVFELPVIETETQSPVLAYKILSEQKEKLGDVSMHGALIHITPSVSPDIIKDHIKKILSDANLKYSEPEEVEPTMDDIFVKLVKRYETNAAG